ncbi:hypothetical protein GCM10023187_05840 [Nibrella viscosa]|uniref:Uncharacterized protein n=1 Tax=Nibrella viscosa TaxID=1084524 RepID=A0ABP8JWF0_9BACT
MNTDSTVRYISNQKGIVGYWIDLNRYTILYSPANSYDTQYTCIVKNTLPAALQKEGTKVIFSGTISTSKDLPKPMMGGQQLFWIQVDEIRKDTP